MRALVRAGHPGPCLAVTALTVLLAVATVVGMYVFRGSPTDEAQERAHVFLAALAADDSETAAALLCQKARDGRTDDEALEDSTLYGRAAIERILGGMLIEERDLHTGE